MVSCIGNTQKAYHRQQSELVRVRIVFFYQDLRYKSSVTGLHCYARYLLQLRLFLDNSVRLSQMAGRSGRTERVAYLACAPRHARFNKSRTLKLRGLRVDIDGTWYHRERRAHS